MKKFLLSLILALAIWIQVDPPTKMCKDAFAFVESSRNGWMLVLASVEQYEWGWYWRVYRDNRTGIAMFYGTERTRKLAEKEISHHLLGGRFI